ncbi:MAG: phosphatidylserine decarboxylase family protein [Calditrichaeota bacterium]|nr:phosphatidylserine decarboxylase family protein [Calditrichota bacterium]
MLPITKYGTGIVAGSWAVFLIFLILSLLFRQPVLIVFTIISGIFSSFNLLFFRDPDRSVPANTDVILSPADGKVIQITEVSENEFFKEKVTRVSIFLSVFDVHVNRSPFSGTVEYFRYKRGSFLPAFKEDASLENEQTAIGIRDDRGRQIMFTQIAGIIARRIVCELREGHQTSAGERMGMIRYGSRADIYFRPEEVELSVKPGDKVQGGETIIGVFK